MMKTLVRPQAKITIAISSDQKQKKNLESGNTTFRLIQSLCNLRHMMLFISVLICIFVSDSPELHSELCIKNNSQQACNIF